MVHTTNLLFYGGGRDICLFICNKSFAQKKIFQIKANVWQNLMWLMALFGFLVYFYNRVILHIFKIYENGSNFEFYKIILNYTHY